MLDKFSVWIKAHKIIAIGGVVGLFVFYYIYKAMQPVASSGTDSTLAQEQLLLQSGVPTATQVAAQQQQDQLAAAENNQNLQSQAIGAQISSANEQSGNTLTAALAAIGAQVTTALAATQATVTQANDAVVTNTTASNNALAAALADIQGQITQENINPVTSLPGNVDQIIGGNYDNYLSSLNAYLSQGVSQENYTDPVALQENQAYITASTNALATVNAQLASIATAVIHPAGT